MDDNKSKLKEFLFQISWEATKEKFGVLPIISGLVLALLAVGLSGGLFTINASIKFLATALLLLMILSLQIYYSETINVIVEAGKKLDKHTNTKTFGDTSLNWTQSVIYLLTGKVRGEKKEADFFERFSSQFPAYAITVLWFVVFMMIIEIWS